MFADVVDRERATLRGNAAVQKHLEKDVSELFEEKFILAGGHCVDKLLRFLLPLYIREGKSYLRIGLGCTGGKHRSVAVTERLAARLAGEAIRLRVRHRDMERE